MMLKTSRLKVSLFILFTLSLIGCKEAPYEGTSKTLASLINLEVASQPIVGKYCEVMPSAAVSQEQYESRVNEVSECTLSGDIASFTDNQVGMAATFGEDATSSGLGDVYLKECSYERSKYLRIISSNRQFACWDAPYRDVVELIISETDPNSSERDCANLYNLEASHRYRFDWACLNGKTSVFDRAFTPIDIDFSNQQCPAGRTTLPADIAIAEDGEPRAATDTEKRRLLEEQNLSIDCDKNSTWSIRVPEEFGLIGMPWYSYNTSSLATPSVNTTWQSGGFTDGKFITFTATSNPVLNNQSISRRDACLWSVAEFGGGAAILFGRPIVDTMLFDTNSPTRDSNLCIRAPSGVDFSLEASNIGIGNDELECLDLNGTNQNLCYPAYAVHSQNPSVVTKLLIDNKASNNLSICTKIEGNGIPSQYVQDICVTETLLDNDRNYEQWGAGEPDNGEIPDGRTSCTILNSSGDWAEASCEENHAFACRHSTDVANWIITNEQGGWLSGENACRAAGSNPGEYVFAKPNNEYENLKLNQMLGSSSIWINYVDLDTYFLVNLIGEQPRLTEQVANGEKVFSSSTSVNLVNLGIDSEHLNGDTPLKYTYSMACEHDGGDPRYISLSAAVKNSRGEVIAQSNFNLSDPCADIDSHEYFIFATGFENIGAQSPYTVDILESFIQSNINHDAPEIHHGLRMLPPNLLPSPYFNESTGWEVEAPWQTVSGRQGNQTAIRSLEASDSVSHTIDLNTLGFSSAYMDSAHPEIITSIWVEVFSCDDDAVIIELLGSDDAVIADYYMELNDIVANDNCEAKSWLPLSRIIANYPDGVRKIRWTLNAVNRHWTSESSEGSKFEAPYIGILSEEAYNKLNHYNVITPSPRLSALSAPPPDCGGYNQPYCEEWTTGQQAATVAGTASLLAGGGICAVGILTSWFTFGTSAALCAAGGLYGIAGGVAVGASINNDGRQYCTEYTGLVINDSICQCPSGKQWRANSHHCVTSNPLLDPYDLAVKDVENNLARLLELPSATLTTQEETEMETIRTRYESQYNQNPSNLSQIKNEANIEWHQRIAYFHLDRLYDAYSPRLHDYDNERSGLADLKAKIEDMISRSPDSYTQDDYYNFAQDITVLMDGRFTETIFDRVCSISGRECSETPNEQDIHRALYWAALAYENQSRISSNLTNGPHENAIYDRVDLSYFDYDGWLTSSSQAFMAVLEEGERIDLVISFRGTSITSYDIVTDSRFVFSNHQLFPNSNISVHSGFQSMWNRHKTGMLSKLTEVFSNNRIDQLRTVYIVGHSLGGGVSTVSAPEIALHLEKEFNFKDSRRIKLINFGSPRTGNQNWSSFITSMEDYFSHVRIYNNRDIIAFVPWEYTFYKHINNAIALPNLPDSTSSWSTPWPESWFTYLPGLLLSLYDASTGREGVDFKHHGTQAYRFNLNRHINPLSINLQQTQAENCIAYQNGVGLMNEPCNEDYRHACEQVNNINLTNSIGSNSVEWTNSWTLSHASGQWNSQSCSIGKFSMPVRQSDLDKLDNLSSSGEKIWVNYNRTPLN
ncbi:MAG: hypothetical protein MI867_03020 [Pseudomonadales bacterium]|nr:hypothetical protein [Pseudomonadales bacterium]